MQLTGTFYASFRSATKGQWCRVIQIQIRAIGTSSTGLRYSFAVRTVSGWNQLPAVVVEQENPAAFKAQLVRCVPVRMPWPTTTTISVILHEEVCQLLCKTRQGPYPRDQRARRPDRLREEAPERLAKVAVPHCCSTTNILLRHGRLILTLVVNTDLYLVFFPVLTKVVNG